MRRIEIIISGLVQGVYFRDNARKIAQSLGLVGFVTNLPDGSVKIVAEGPEKELKEFAKWTKKGPELARIEETNIDWSDPSGEFERFEVK